MFAEFLKKDSFYEKYMQLLNMRLAIGNLEMEDKNSEIISPQRTMEMYNNLAAFKNIINKNPDKISPYDVIDVAYDVNKDLNFFDKGFRVTQVDVQKATKFFPIEAKKVPQAIYSIFNAYHNIWNILPVYEREARLHIELVRLQPFEDGNKRTARIITNFDLCKQNKAPVIISGSETDEYFNYIDNYDVEGFTKFLTKKSEEEFDNMLNLYRTLIGDNFADESINYDLKDGDIRIYEILRKMLTDIKDVDDIDTTIDNDDVKTCAK